MSDISKWMRGALIIAVMVNASAARALDPADLLEIQYLAIEIPQACPKAWESLNTDIIYDPVVDVWQNDLADKAQFIQFALSYALDDDNSMLLSSFSDPKEIVTICASLRYNLFELLGLEADLIANSAGVDADGDGIDDSYDVCLGTVDPINNPVNIVGCANYQLDDDADGVENGSDLCAATSTSEIADANGCAPTQRDTDNDGVNDALDQCTDPPTQGAPNEEGCDPDQIDSDQDGTADYLDPYPHQNDSQCTV